MSTATVIRVAEEKDEKQLIDLMYQYIVDFYKRPRPEEKDVIQLFQHLLHQPEAGRQFVAEKDGTLVGFSTLYFTFSTTVAKKIAILNDLFVVPGNRGEKLGERLFTTSLDYTKENDFALMSWRTEHHNKIGQQLYEKMNGKTLNDQWLNYEIRHI